jgi:hypothetical protein
MRSELLGELTRRIHPVKTLQLSREAQSLEALHQLPPLFRGARFQVSKLPVQILLLGREFPVVSDQLAQQQRHEAYRQLLQQTDPSDTHLSGLWRIAAELFGLQLTRWHGAYATSGSGLPCAILGSNPSSAPRVGTRSVGSTGLSTTTFSRIPGPIAIIQVVRESASPVR